MKLSRKVEFFMCENLEMISEGDWWSGKNE